MDNTSSVPVELYLREMKEMNDSLYIGFVRIKDLQQELATVREHYHEIAEDGDRITKLQKELKLVREAYNEISEDGLNWESLAR